MARFVAVTNDARFPDHVVFVEVENGHSGAAHALASRLYILILTDEVSDPLPIDHNRINSRTRNSGAREVDGRKDLEFSLQVLFHSIDSAEFAEHGRDQVGIGSQQVFQCTQITMHPILNCYL